MQPIDPADKQRRPNVQIAASIRAAILTGELEPGEQLPSGNELAEFFGVSRMTVATAIRKLADEGYVRSVTGSGVYVRDQARLPMGGEEHPLAAMEGADVGRTTALCLLHDAHETRIGDVPSVGRAYITTASPEAVTAHQTAGMPDTVAKTVQELTAEYEATETTESRLAHDADKIETLLQAIEYQSHGYDAEPWRETSLAALRTDAGRQLAQAIGAADPRWWAPFAASYAELRASTRASRTK
jgi:DNA-binding transcriptional regulator YhcF (GntR family)